MWRFELNWNRRLAAKGEGTAAAVSEIIRGHVVGNFVNVAKCKTGRLPWPNIDDLQRLDVADVPADDGLGGFCADETGRASWAVWRVE